MTFETFMREDQTGPTRPRRITFALSLVLHAAVLLVGVAASFWRVDELSAPELVVTLPTFARPAPPPLLAGRAAPRRSKPRPTQIVQPLPQPQAVVQPTEAPETPTTGSETESETGSDKGEPDGVADGEPGGTANGAPTGTSTFLPPSVARGQLAIDPQSDAYRVKLPPILASAGMAVWALVKICVNADGKVTSVSMVKHADPAVDPEIVRMLSTWRYRPYTVNGRPVPFCSVVRYQISPQ